MTARTKPGPVLQAASDLAFKRKREDRVCIRCGRTVRALSTQQYCSRTCRSLAYQERRKAGQTSPLEPTSPKPAVRIAAALDLAARWGTIDGAHHKQWVLDQMVRLLTGCPLVDQTALDHNQQPYHYPALGDSAAYRAFVLLVGDWDVGIAP